MSSMAADTGTRLAASRRCPRAAGRETGCATSPITLGSPHEGRSLALLVACVLGAVDAASSGDPLPRGATPHVLANGSACCICDADDGTNCPCIPRDTSIFFVGDCLTRDQYLDLVYRLKFGKDHAWFRRAENVPGEEWTWARWHSNFTSEKVAHMHGTHHELAPEERCDCHPGFPIYRMLNMENRYFHLPACNVNVSLMSVYYASRGVHTHMRGEYGSLPPTWSGRVIGHMRDVKKYRRDLRLPSALTEVVARFHPDVLVINTGGLWREQPGFDWVGLARAARAAAPCVVWKTTTRPARPAHAAYTDERALRHFAPFAAVFEAGEISEAMTFGRPSGQVYIDDVHFTRQSRVHHALNNELVRGLFPQGPSSAAPTAAPARLRCPKGSFGLWGRQARHELLARGAAAATRGAAAATSADGAERAIDAAMASERAALFEHHLPAGMMEWAARRRRS